MAKDRNSVRRVASARRGLGAAPPLEGVSAADFVANMNGNNAAKKRANNYETTAGASRLHCGAFLQCIDKTRAPIPFSDKKRVKVQCTKPGDSDFCPASYAAYDREEYILMQAPKDKQSAIDYWRVVWQDGCKLLVSVTPASEISETASEKNVFPYWPREDGTSLVLGDGGRFTIKCTKKTESKGFSTYDLLLKSTEEEMPTSSSSSSKTNQEEGEAADEKEKQDRQITLLHAEHWSADHWPDIDQVAIFVQTVSKKELQVIRKAVDNYVPPVMLQGFEAIGRTCIVWLCTILYKDIEKKEGFDIEDLIKKLVKFRPGALNSRLHFTVAFAVSYRLASMSGWTSQDDTMKKIAAIKDTYEKFAEKDKHQ